MLRQISFLIFCFSFFEFVYSQNYFDVGYSFGANATTSKTIKSDNMTWGYYTPPLPSSWSNHFFMGWGTKTNRIYLAFDDGGLGPTWAVKTYPRKYPYDDQPGLGFSTLSTQTTIKAKSRRNSNLSKISFLYKRNLLNTNDLSHYGLIGIGYLKTRVVKTGGSSFGKTFYANDSLGFISHGINLDKYEYFRNQNVYLIFGYELNYRFAKRMKWNTQIIYNQGLYKMIRWHTYRTYSESLTNYTEFDEQWSFTRLSYFAFLTGISYEFGAKKNKTN